MKKTVNLHEKAYWHIVDGIKQKIQDTWDALDLLFPGMDHRRVVEDLQDAPKFLKREVKPKTARSIRPRPFEEEEEKKGGRPLGTKKCGKCSGMTPKVDQHKDEDGLIVCTRCFGKAA